MCELGGEYRLFIFGLDFLWLVPHNLERDQPRSHNTAYHRLAGNVPFAQAKRHKITWKAAQHVPWLVRPTPLSQLPIDNNVVDVWTLHPHLGRARS